MLGEDLVRERGHGALVRDVQPVRAHGDAAPAGALGDRVEARRVHVRQRQVAAARRQCLGERGADAARRSGDDGHAAEKGEGHSASYTSSQRLAQASGLDGAGDSTFTRLAARRC